MCASAPLHRYANELACALFYRRICLAFRCVAAQACCAWPAAAVGGSSNHFRTEALRKVGGWDPYNVTEDADLGIRLARFGYRSATIASTTYEEAPADSRRWLRQRSRWFKGWMQTWLVHMREPRQLFHELGIRGFLTFQLVVGGNALIALAHPVLLFGLGWELIQSTGDHQAAAARLQYYIAVAAPGYCASAALGFAGLWHRRMLHKA